jgi:hypothetical protein
MPVNGPKNTVYPDMNDINFGADASISQGHRAHPPKIAQSTCPRLILIYRGNKTIISLAALNVLADMFVPTSESIKLKEAKNAAARLSHRSIRRSGSQSTSPYIISPAEVTAMPEYKMRRVP